LVEIILPLPPQPPLSVKIQSGSYSFNIAEAEYDNQIALSPSNVKGEGIILENCVCEKKQTIGFQLQHVLSNNEKCHFTRYNK